MFQVLLRQGLDFTSDSWSFGTFATTDVQLNPRLLGVLGWEVFSHGNAPYGEGLSNQQLGQGIIDGTVRLTCPEVLRLTSDQQ